MGKSKRRSKARRAQAGEARGQATKPSPTFVGPYLVYRAGAPESLARMLRRLVTGVGAGALLQSCVVASAQRPAAPEVGQEQPRSGSRSDARQDEATKGNSHPERVSKPRSADPALNPKCWSDAPQLSRVEEVAFESNARVMRDLEPLGATCVLACPLPPVEVGEPVDAPRRNGRRTIVEYTRLPCEEDEKRNVICRFQKRLLVQTDGCKTILQIGRRPRGMGELGSSEQQSETADWLARAAALEAASVPAFEELARSLEALGAPVALVQDAHRAAGDERRHALFVGALASRYGAEALSPSLTPSQPASREELGLENLIEGCVRETLGAAYALWQARHASDPAVRAVMKTIAKDEARHADLAWRVHAWLGHPRHDEALAAAIESLRKDAFSDELVTTLGLPPRDVQLALLADVEEALWRPAASRAA